METNNDKIGCPKLVNYKDGYSVLVNDITLTNIAGFELDLTCEWNPTLTLEVVAPEVDLKIGHYHISYSYSENCEVKLYKVTDLRTNDTVECQHLTFDGHNLTISKGEAQLSLDKEIMQLNTEL